MGGKLPVQSNVTRISQAMKPVSSNGVQQVRDCTLLIHCSCTNLHQKVVYYQAGIGSTGYVHFYIITLQTRWLLHHKKRLGSKGAFVACIQLIYLCYHSKTITTGGDANVEICVGAFLIESLVELPLPGFLRTSEMQ